MKEDTELTFMGKRVASGVTATLIVASFMAFIFFAGFVAGHAWR